MDYWQGRTEERQKIGKWMADGNIRLIGITGLGGFGKSTLAVKIYEEDSAEFVRIGWVDVSRRVTFTELARRVLLRLGFSASTVDAIPELSLVDALVNHLREGRYLLVIDNLESLLQPDGQWLDAIYEQFFHGWLGCGGKSVILVTTRERPDFPAIKLKWLPLPGLSPAEGAYLLRAAGVLGTEAELQDFAKKAEGHPLLLTLVANFLIEEEQPNPQINYLQNYGLANVSQLLTDEKLKGSHREGKTDIWMRLVLDASFHRLSDKLQRLLLNLSVYRIAFNGAMADAQLPGEEVSERDLRQLARRSLLQEERDKNRGRWFQFHPFILAYIKQKASNLTEAHQKAIAYYKENAKSEPWQTISDVAEYLEVFYHCYELGKYDDAFKAIGLCADFLTLRGYNIDLVELYRQLVEAWQQSNSESWEFAASLNSLGNAYNSLGQYQSAIDYLQQSLAITREMSARNGEAKSLIGLGNAYNSLGQYRLAIDYLEQSLAIFREISDCNGEAASLGNLGSAYCSLGQYSLAIDYYQQSLAILPEVGDCREEAYSLIGLGNACHSLGQYRLAIDYLQQSLAIFREIGDRNGEANSLIGLGSAYNSLGQYPIAIDYFQQSLAIFREIGDRNGEANSLIGLGNAYNSLGQYPIAIGYYQQSLAIQREIGDRNGEATSLIGLGSAYNSLGQYPLAIDYYQQSLAIFREIGHCNGEAKSLNNLGNVYNSLGKYRLAIDYSQQSLGLKREIGDRNGEANSLNNLGNAYGFQGQYRLAIDYYQQSLAIQREIGDCNGEANSLGNLGNAYDSLGQYRLAIDYHQQSLAIHREIGNCNGEAISLSNLGTTLAKLGRKLEAVAAYQNACDLYQAMGLDADVQHADNAIQRLSKKTNIWMSLPKAIVGLLLRWVNRLWRLLHTFFRQR
ncbi:tetratricopeptide repeat protein [Funiculus sociatus GB2-A5]|uniref:Tetratricopeptide repeat protein n=1 Tax=Funiculus sociatus GB2-A5 TaxID=2933946 RepID=A0ABV0JIQ4_9CYAN|nr:MULTISPECIES: tetratricopeptide repeat protein [unclassified Trichocoleus]MBD1904664.1 tetratricopeptide repeat protein [Trichocoleus sp. FACHB-832]MBD2062463.1 tetratricopeptide repeat protein [Trichocoleus sp. FACHB-6]